MGVRVVGMTYKINSKFHRRHRERGTVAPKTGSNSVPGYRSQYREGSGWRNGPLSFLEVPQVENRLKEARPRSGRPATRVAVGAASQRAEGCERQAGLTGAKEAEVQRLGDRVDVGPQKGEVKDNTQILARVLGWTGQRSGIHTGDAAKQHRLQALERDPSRRWQGTAPQAKRPDWKGARGSVPPGSREESH